MEKLKDHNIELETFDIGLKYFDLDGGTYFHKIEP